MNLACVNIVRGSGESRIKAFRWVSIGSGFLFILLRELTCGSISQRRSADYLKRTHHLSLSWMCLFDRTRHEKIIIIFFSIFFSRLWSAIGGCLFIQIDKMREKEKSRDFRPFEADSEQVPSHHNLIGRFEEEVMQFWVGFNDCIIARFAEHKMNGPRNQLAGIDHLAKMNVS